MFRKVKDFFKTTFGGRNGTRTSLDGGSVTSSDEVLSNTEFAIKYRRHAGSVPRMVPIGLELEKGNSEGLNDTVAFLMHCSTHNKLAVYQDEASGVKWLPFTPQFQNKSWTESAVIGTLLVVAGDSEETYMRLKTKPPISSVRLMEILRIQLPRFLSFLTRVIFYVKLKSDPEMFECCAKTKHVIWMPLEELAEGIVPQIWGPELVQYARLVHNELDRFEERIEEFSLDDVYLYAPRDPPRNAEETMLLELNISEKTIEILYNDFLEHCYPCFSLPLESFKHYMSKYGFDREDDRLNSLFIAFNYKKNGYISFHELLLGLVSIEPNARHQETRIKFIFRFYDFTSKGYLDVDDFERMVADIYPKLEGDELQHKVQESIVAVGTSIRDGKKVMTFANFTKAITGHRFRGTSRLCRSTVPVFMQLTKAFIHNRKKPTIDDLKEWGDLGAVLLPRTHKGSCSRCQSTRYKLAMHSVSIDPNGYICNPVRVVSDGSDDNRSMEFVFSATSVSNVLLKMLREFNDSKGSVAQPRGLLDGEQDRKKMYDLLVKLSNEVKPVLRSESRLPEVDSPCFVIGDIHGNIEDLLTMERLIWRSMPCFGPNYLFLGDYVDRGKWGFECALYLLALKVLDPKKILLLRGNHEVRNLQEKYTYKRECFSKYGNEYGEKIWLLTNQMFDLLPVAAIVDNAIFCTHGGLSPNATTLDQIRKIPTNLSDPEHQSKIAWELLWSDPCHMQQYLDCIELTDASNEFAHQGYVYNQKRGAAYLFNERAATTFLGSNHLTHMIRAHEVPLYGFAHHFTNICTTVFSCSHYCNNNNEAACILVHNSRIRVIRLDTHNNAPATDK